MALLDNTQYVSQSLDQQDLLFRISNRIRESLELTEILAATVAEVRTFTGTDRVKVYRFHQDGHGEVVAESIQASRLPSLLGLHFPADDIPPQARELYLKTRHRSIVDVASQQILLSQPNAPLTTAAADLTVEDVHQHTVHDILQRAVDPCHIEYLTAMGVLSSLVIPIVQGNRLWGLLVCHHAQPRIWSAQELHILQLVVDQVAIAIAQSNLLDEARLRSLQEAAVNHVSTLLHTLPTIEIQAALEATVAVLQGAGGRVYLMPSIPDATGTIYTCGTQPAAPSTEPVSPIEQTLTWQTCFRPKATAQQSALRVITDLYREPQLRTLAPLFQDTAIRGLLVVPLQYRHELLGYLSVFRDEVEVETLWAGRVNPDQRQQQPRNSFAAWRELKRGQAPTWLPTTVELAQALAKHFAMAVQQYRLYCQVQTLNVTLESQVQERTAQLQQTTKQQQALFDVTTKIRQSLELSTIFQATVSEIRHLLQVDRVSVFRFEPDSDCKSGAFIAEDGGAGLASVLGRTVVDRCFGEQYASRYEQGQIQAFADIDAAHLTDCHYQFLAQFQVKANLVVPLILSGRLWGLLCIHQCQATRHWEPAEIDFVSQIATQLGVALQQADLLTQTQQQAEQLAQALHVLQRTQSQLVQTEKMSSLGQLVAGVAHEINNPVNFIYGNLNHVTEYAESLLALIAVYQQQYPQPVEPVRAVLEAIDLEFLAKDFPKILSSMRIGADRIRQIVESLRNFSRFDQAEKKLIDIHEGIDSTLLILQHRLKPNGNHPGIEVIKAYGDLPAVECYAGELNQVFMNILANAIDALLDQETHRSPDLPPHPGIITITTALQGQMVRISIADNGPGMTETTRAKLFDPFFTTKPIGKGTGLGLAISYQVVVDRHGGSLGCHSQPGQGAEFWLEIPLQQPSSPSNMSGTAPS